MVGKADIRCVPCSLAFDDAVDRMIAGEPPPRQSSK